MRHALLLGRVGDFGGVEKVEKRGLFGKPFRALGRRFRDWFGDVHPWFPVDGAALGALQHREIVVGEVVRFRQLFVREVLVFAEQENQPESFLCGQEARGAFLAVCCSV